MPKWLEGFFVFGMILLCSAVGLRFYLESTDLDSNDIAQGAMNYLNTQDFEETFHSENTTLIESNDNTVTLLVDGETYYTNYEISGNLFNKDVSFSNAQKANK